MKSFRDIVLNEALQESINKTLKDIAVMSSKIQELESCTAVIKNVKTYMNLPINTGVQRLERTYSLIKDEIDSFLGTVSSLRKHVQSKVIDEVEEMMIKLKNTLVHSYTQKTKNLLINN